MYTDSSLHMLLLHLSEARLTGLYYRKIIAGCCLLRSQCHYSTQLHYETISTVFCYSILYTLCTVVGWGQASFTFGAAADLGWARSTSATSDGQTDPGVPGSPWAR